MNEIIIAQTLAYGIIFLLISSKAYFSWQYYVHLNGPQDGEE